MGAQRIPSPITVEEYERVPDPPGRRYELHHGELVGVTYPIRQHKALQRRLRKLLEGLFEPKGFIVDTEYPYRPLLENEVWGADIACVHAARDTAAEKWLIGSPELVIEVKSPSNSKAELHDKAMTTLAGDGAVEFWIVDPYARTIVVHSKAGMAAYDVTQSVPVPIIVGSISVADVLTGMV